MKLIYFLAAFIVSVLIAMDVQAAGANTKEEFVKKASMSNLFEIESSRLAKDRAKDPDVKSFAESMIKDHTKAAADLKAAVRDAGLSETLIATALDEDHNDKIRELREKTGEDFDQTYMDMQESAHDKAVELFEDYLEDGDDQRLKEFAGKTLPTLKAHKERADGLD